MTIKTERARELITIIGNGKFITGKKQLSDQFDLNMSTIHRWQQPKESGGFDGIPSVWVESVLQLASEKADIDFLDDSELILELIRDSQSYELVK
tara:strand:+ start:4032 stop:4316 length:285 start_codon:yes stop_codon:yes gene_type:complete